MTDTGASSDKPTFEAAFELLQQTVKRLESGELGLEQALKCFEEGVRLTRVCQEHLSVAEQRIEILTRATADGQIQIQPFNPDKA